MLPGVGDGSVPAVLTLARRPKNEEFFGGGGVDIADVRLEIRGILVGVSLGRLPTEFNKDDEWMSLVTGFDAWGLLAPTDGDPAMVGN